MQKPASKRWLYLKDWMFKEFGKTKGCPACHGKDDRRSELCRARITPLVEEKMRKKEAADRQAAEDARFAVGRAPEPGIREESSSSSGAQQMEQDDVEMMSEDEEARGQKRGAGDDEEDKKRPRVYGFDDDVDDGDMTASLM